MTNVVNSNIVQKVDAAREFIKRNLATNSKLHGHEKQKSQVYNILKRTVVHAESDSLLLVGPHGCGKTTLLTECLRDLEQECGVDNYIVINLNGFVHTDDNLALKEIIQQIHVKELDGDKISGSFSDNLLFVLHSLKSGDRSSSKAVIFILDEFNLFCSHHNQTLLYNLFDVAQSAQAPICVVGLTTHIDITEMLEKRVKSRFSHRQVMLQPNYIIADRLLLIIDYLGLPEERKLIRKPLDKQFNSSWNDHILEIFKSKNIINNVQRLLDLDPSEKKLKSWLFLVASKISYDPPHITEELVEEIIGTQKDQRVKQLKDLSVLEFCLIIAMCHHNEIYEGDPFNFEMIFKRYAKFASENHAAQNLQKPILLKSYERLQQLELISPISEGIKTVKKEYQLHNVLVTNSQMKEAANTYNGLPTDVAQWASSSIFCL